MMGPDDIGERRPVNHTPTIALSIAAILFLIVGALSYRDFVRSSLEKEFAEKEARLMQRQGGYGNVTPGQQVPQGAREQVYMQNGIAVNAQGIPINQQGGFQNQAPVGFQPPANLQYDAQGNPLAAAPVIPPGYQETGTLPVPNDPELANIRASLDQAREQSRLTEQRYNQLSGNVDSQAREAAAMAANTANTANTANPVVAPAGSTAITEELPDFLRNAVENPPGGNPEIEERLGRMRQQVVAAPSLGKVTSYDKDWGIVTFNAGAGQGVKVEQRFAVRRGSEILGWIKVDEVQDEQSIAVLVTKNRESDTSIKPEVGDDLIDFELF
jgi:hypothetical protein